MAPVQVCSQPSPTETSRALSLRQLSLRSQNLLTFSSYKQTKTSKSAKAKQPKVTKKYVINCSQPVSDKIFDVSAFEKFLHDRIKIEGRTGNLGDQVAISQQGDGKVEVVAHIPFSGRYLKYLYVLSPEFEGVRNSCAQGQGKENDMLTADVCTGRRNSSRSNSCATGYGWYRQARGSMS